MSVTIECPKCGKHYTVDPTASGKTALCEACGTKMQIPDLGSAAGRPAAERDAPEAEPLPDLGFAPGEFEPLPIHDADAPVLELVSEPASPPGPNACPHCGQQVAAATVKCPHCHQFMMGYEPPKAEGGTTSVLAIASLICGIVSLALVPCCGVGGLLAIPAIIAGALAKRECDRSNGRISGQGLAIAGLVIGILSLLLSAFWLLITILGSLVEA